MGKSTRLTITFFAAIISIIGLLTPGFGAPFGIPHPILHFLVFLIGGLLIFSLRIMPKNTALIMISLYAILSEIGQFYVPQRTPELIDIYCNLYGIAVAYILTSIYREIQNANYFRKI